MICSYSVVTHFGFCSFVLDLSPLNLFFVFPLYLVLCLMEFARFHQNRGFKTSKQPISG
jgi:hypothetical protein